jgi:hypothetical protein
MPRPENTEWIAALQEGEIDEAVDRVRAGAPLTAEGMEEIVISEAVPVLEAFLQAGGSPDTVLEGRTLLTAVVWGLRHALRAQERRMDLGEIRRLVEVLVAYGADLNLQDAHGQTVLMALFPPSGEGYPVLYTSEGVALVQWLIELGAEVDLQDRRGRTALMGLYAGYSALFGQRPSERRKVRSAMRGLSAAFREAGADLEIEDADGRTARDFLGRTVGTDDWEGGGNKTRRRRGRGRSRGHSKKTRALSSHGIRSLLERRVSRRARGASRAKRASRKGKGRRTALLSSTR